MMCAVCGEPATHRLLIRDQMFSLCVRHECICGTSEKGSHLCEALTVGRSPDFVDAINPQGLPINIVRDDVWKRGTRV